MKLLRTLALIVAASLGAAGLQHVVAPALASVWQWSQTASSNATADPSINWSEGMSPSSVNDSARAMMAQLAKWRDDTAGIITTGGTSTAYTLTTNGLFTSAATMSNKSITVRFHTANGTSPTINVDGQGAAQIVQKSGTSIISGTLQTNAIYAMTYDNAVPEWIIHGIVGVVGTDSVATGSIQDNAVTDAKLRNSTGLSVIGRASNSSGDPADIVAGSDEAVLRRSGTAIGFGTVTSGGIDTGAVSYTKLASGVTATQAEQEAGSTTQAFVTPGRQQYHTSASKSWVVWAGASGAVQGSYNASVSRSGTGAYTVSFAQNMSSDAFAPVCQVIDGSGNLIARVDSQATTGYVVTVRNTSGTASDPSRMACSVFGDL